MGFFILLTAYVIHDMQTSEGIGLYYVLKTNTTHRLIFDLCADAFFLLAFCIGAAYPMFGTKHLHRVSGYTFLVMFIALMPVVHPTQVFTLMHDITVYLPHLDFKSYLTDIIEPFRLILPLLVISSAVTVLIRQKEFGRFNIRRICIATLLLVPAMFFSNIAFVFLFVSSYLYLIVLFDMLERSELKLIVFKVVLSFAALYKLIYLSINTHI